ncbi:MAG TPA: MFS transporter [Gemmatimonadales bacterium]|nr:MFS transporter [Gemmatimonadales bacterium]
MTSPPPPPPPPLDRRRILAWCLFDFANSAYSAVIVATVFSIYYVSHIVGNERGLGDLWWGRAISASLLGVVLTGPVLGALADRAGFRKRFFIAFTLLCIACIALFTTLGPGMVLRGFALIALANFGFESSQIYYNAYLPDIAPPDRLGTVSGLGFGIGYLGSIAGLIVALPLVNARQFDLLWLLVAAFFAVFSIPAFLALPGDRPRPETTFNIRRIFRDVLANRDLRRFLLAYFVYFDGVETTIVFSGIFAVTTLKFTTPEVIKLFLAVQFSALTGALLLARPTDRWGPKRVITLTLLLWIGVSVGAYFAQTKSTFVAVAVTAGLGLGSIQAASRALMASLIPPGKESELFGFYALCGKSSSVLGPLVFGAVSYLLGGDQRTAVVSVGLFFVVGLVLLQRVRPASRPS